MVEVPPEDVQRAEGISAPVEQSQEERLRSVQLKTIESLMENCTKAMEAINKLYAEVASIRDGLSECKSHYE